MNLPNDFFAKRLAAIELEKAHYAAIPLLVDCIEKMQLAGPNRTGNRRHISTGGRSTGQRDARASLSPPKEFSAGRLIEQVGADWIGLMPATSFQGFNCPL